MFTLRAYKELKPYLSCLLRLYYLYIDNTGVFHFIPYHFYYPKTNIFLCFLTKLNFTTIKNRVRIKIVSL